MLKINEAAKMLHVNPNALRFYEKKGVLVPHRDENCSGRRKVRWIYFFSSMIF